MQSQKAISAYLTRKQMLPFDFAEQTSSIPIISHSVRTPGFVYSDAGADEYTKPLLFPQKGVKEYTKPSRAN